MAAMMPSGTSGNQSANPYEHYDAPAVEDDLIDPDDGMPSTAILKNTQLS
jgi:hypothetical protein